MHRSVGFCVLVLALWSPGGHGWGFRPMTGTQDSATRPEQYAKPGAVNTSALEVSEDETDEQANATERISRKHSKEVMGGGRFQVDEHPIDVFDMRQKVNGDHSKRPTHDLVMDPADDDPAMDQDYDPLRARRSSRGNTLPPPLIESTRQYFGRIPEPKRVQPDKLMRHLGSHFDAQWMAVTKPAEKEVHPPRELDSKLVPDLRQLNLTIVDGETSVQLKPLVQKQLELWLLQKASCSIKYVWKDIGPYFWPRYVKNGVCDRTQVCSWPPGMRCVAEENRKIRILRWQCRARRNVATHNRKRNRKRKRNRDATVAGLERLNIKELLQGKRKLPSQQFDRRTKRKKIKFKCRWRKTKYPVTAECFCSC